MKCDFIQNYYVFNCSQKQLQNYQSFTTQRENGKKNSLRKLFQFLFCPFSLQICTKVIFLKDLGTGANFDFSKVRLMKICRSGLQGDEIWIPRTLGNMGVG